MVTSLSCASSGLYDKEDVESMRHAFRRACEENPIFTNTTTQRLALAKAILKRFQPGADETQLITRVG